jgi:hypothetical protein
VHTSTESTLAVFVKLQFPVGVSPNQVLNCYDMEDERIREIESTATNIILDSSWLIVVALLASTAMVPFA